MLPVRILFFVAFLLLLGLDSFCVNPAPGAKERIDKIIRYADKAYDERNFEKALVLYEKALELDKENPIALFQVEATKSALGIKVNCDNIYKSIEKGFPAGEYELRFFGCIPAQAKTQ
ncbi:MAG: hypothetical protein ACXITV_06870 [Luteibaculaceae bacterium]